MPREKIYVNPAFGLENTGFFRTTQAHPDGNLRSAGISHSLRNNDWPDTRRMYSFPYYTFNIMLKDSCGVYRNEKGYKCQLAYGDYFFTFPGVKHLYGPSEGEYWNELFVNYGGKAFDHYYRQKYFCPEHPVWHLENPEPWIQHLINILRKPRPTTLMAIAAEASRFLSLLFEMMDVAYPKQQVDISNDWFDRACLLLTADMRNEIDLRKTARNLGMGYSSFRLHFSRRAGMPPYQYREKKRIEAACRSLAENPSKLHKEIAFSLGYSREDHFSRQFKKHTGMLPGEYRRKYGKACD